MKNVKKVTNYKLGVERAKAASSGEQLLCAEVIAHAVEDWRWLIKHRAWTEEGQKYQTANCSFNELRAFFKSAVCETYTLPLPISPTRILEMLEKELQEAQQAPPPAKGKRGKKQ